MSEASDDSQAAPGRVVQMADWADDARFASVEDMLETALEAVRCDGETFAARAVLVLLWRHPDGTVTYEPRAARCDLTQAIGLMTLGQDAMLRRDDGDEI